MRDADLAGDVNEVVAHTRKVHGQGAGVISMKLVGEGKFTRAEDRDAAMKFAMNLGVADAVTIGFKSTAEIDEAIERMNRVMNYVTLFAPLGRFLGPDVSKQGANLAPDRGIRPRFPGCLILTAGKLPRQREIAGPARDSGGKLHIDVENVHLLRLPFCPQKRQLLPGALPLRIRSDV
jgi:hypothetical protein